jgi:hypothetical protein
MGYQVAQFIDFRLPGKIPRHHVPGIIGNQVIALVVFNKFSFLENPQP